MQTPLSCLAALSLALSFSTAPLHAAPSFQQTSPSGPDIQGAAIQSIRAGDYEHARALLDSLLLEDFLSQAAELVEAGDPARALVRIDRALQLAPKHTPTLIAKAETSLRLSQKAIREGGPGSLINGGMQDAFDYFVKASKQDPGSTFGAVRAALALGNSADALDWARRGRALLDEAQSSAQALEAISPLPQRSMAEAFFGAYAKSKAALDLAQAELPEASERPAELERQFEATRALFIEAEDALGDLLGRDCLDPWLWSTLSDLYLWEKKPKIAFQRLQQGIERVPGNPVILGRISQVAHQALGRKDSVLALEDIVSKNPTDTISHYYLGLERFEYAMELFANSEYDAQLFAQSEAEFRRSREIFEGNTDICLAYELVARCGQAWCAYYGDSNLELAAELFQSMNELKEGGIVFALGERLRSGVDGLAFVGDAFNQRGDNLNAALCFEAAHRAAPSDGRWANNAGFFLRDAAVEAETLGKRLCAAARGEVQDPERLAELRDAVGIDPTAPPADEAGIFHRAALTKLAFSRELITRSWLAYEQAAKLYPDDVRIVNDAALVLVYYDHSKLDLAESLLKRSTELGAIQVPAMRAEIDAAELDEAERASREIELRDLTEAWGDAYQNLGVLEWVHRANQDKALAYLERSVAIGPDPRPDLSNNLIPIVRGEQELQHGNYFDLKDWGQPCAQN